MSILMARIAQSCSSRRVNFPPGKEGDLEALGPPFCLAVSAKRYVLFNKSNDTSLSARRPVTVSVTYFAAYDEEPAEIKKIGVPLWQEDLWKEIIRAAERSEASHVHAEAEDWLVVARELAKKLGGRNKLAAALGVSGPYLGRVLRGGEASHNKPRRQVETSESAVEFGVNSKLHASIISAVSPESSVAAMIDLSRSTRVAARP